LTTARREFDRRVEPGRALAADAEEIARACHAMADRFQAGGKLVVFGNGTGATDAEHIAVEFVHPVIVGKRALPALSLAEDPATLTGLAARVGFDEMFAHQVRQLAVAGDIALGVSSDGACVNVARGLEAAHAGGCLTVALVGGDGGPIAKAPFVDHALVARSDDPCVVKEIHVTMYHVLWELVHVFFEQAAPSPVTRSNGVPAEAQAAPEQPECHDEVCITCSDQALPVRVLELRPGDLALVDTGSGTEEVSVALVDAKIGGRVLVHAKEAIAVLEEDEGPGPGVSRT
jgi:D-sedoheptulose 7-phosphate isomerase